MSSAVANTLSVGGGVPPGGSSAAEFGHPTPRRTPLLVAILFTLSVATSGIVIVMQGRALEELRAEISAIRVGAKEQIRAIQAHSKALQALRAKLSQTQQEQVTAVQAQRQELEAMSTEASKAQQELATDLHAQKQAFEALRTETLQRQQEQATAVQVQNQAFEAMRVEMSSMKQELKAQMSTLKEQQYATDVLARELGAHLGGDELKAAMVNLRGENAQRRKHAATTLSGLGGSSLAAGAAARHALVAALRGDADLGVRMLAAQHLGLLPDATLVPPLTTALLKDKNLDVRRDAAMSLGLVGAPAALTAVTVLTSAMRTDPDEGVRAAAAGALLALDAQGLASEAQGVALKVLASGSHRLDRERAAWAVGRGTGPKAKAALEKAASGDADESVRAEAKRALRTLRS